MRKILLCLTVITLAGCASRPIPMPAPAPAEPVGGSKCISIPGKGCKQINAGNVGGTTLGNRNDNILEEDSD